MNVEEFVSESIRQIVSGVKKAGEASEEHGATVVPSDYIGGMAPMQMIAFDVAVTVETDIEGKVSGKANAGFLQVLKGEVSTEASGSRGHTTANRLSFSIPVELPSRQRAEGARPPRSDATWI